MARAACARGRAFREELVDMKYGELVVGTKIQASLKIPQTSIHQDLKRHERAREELRLPFQNHLGCWVELGKINVGLGNIKGLDDAIFLYENMARMRPLPCVKQFTQLLSRVVNLKEYSAAICLFKDICNLGISVNEYTMNIAIDSCCLSNRVNDGFSILGLFFKRGCVPDGFTFSSLLKGLFRENRIIEAQELFQKIVRERLCELDVVTYGIVVYGLCKAGNTAMAIELLRVMEKGSCKPNIHIYSSVIDSLCKNRMIRLCLEDFR
ncbi:hypothetical protein DH2020_030272 [Rehmannia glutinosa]|uniref:Pentatricopeptide repeat-containing protein n=1 Tax=Rehmannia glutinosa TaxID=99300 RepID=A0ABR0VQF2_REHGL